MKKACAIAWLFAALSASLFGTDSVWTAVPARDHLRTNPFAEDATAARAGAGIYQRHCAQCHGDAAEGDGNKRPSLRTTRIRSATDGDLEWFLRQGRVRRGMPSWSSLPQAQRWQLIQFLRSLQGENGR